MTARRFSPRKRILLLLAISFSILGYLRDRLRPRFGISRFSEQPHWRESVEHGGSATKLPATRLELRNRAFVSCLPNSTTDGMGHRFAIINYELLLAIHMRVGYVHRVATYGSLSPPEDPQAVERLFGWDRNLETRDDIFMSSCAEVEYRSPLRCSKANNKNYPICRALRPDGHFKHLVLVPPQVSDCFRMDNKTGFECREGLRTFADKYNESDTLFQMTPSLCEAEYREGNFKLTGAWLREQYWKRHHNQTILSRDYRGRKHRTLPFEKHRLQIAVHIRRGDFQFYTNRQMIPDSVYADVIAAIIRSAGDALERRVPASVAIFSEGVPAKGYRLKFNHDINKMLPFYVTEKGEKIKRPSRHWKRLLRPRLPYSAKVKMRTFIATDTITTIHAMSCADVFVGSQSGLSMQLVATLSRGLQVLPTKPQRSPTSTGMSIRYSYTKNGTARIVHSALRRGIKKVYLQRHNHF